ncbi:MAG TPA: HAMP domain-containing sensor histidine kinase [Blastocatellia bacterium]|jgi:signal transduction histidine kinase|nr:HAMP domain-containing sensor histidine kinase [Blastocatellia bacterium]
MRIQSNRKSVYFYIALGASLVALAVAGNVGWVVFHWRQVAMLVFGVIFFVLIIAGLVLNTIFLVREIRRNEQHNSFINAVTHELKTPIASIRLYLETMQTRRVDEAKRQEFYQIMLDDCDRLHHTVEQVLRASRTGHRRRHIHKTVIDLGELTRECLELARKRTHLNEKALRFVESINRGGERAMVLGDADELRAAISNLIDNAIKYSDGKIDVSVEVVAPADMDDKRVAVRVTDRGMGVPQGELKRIFKRFYRAPRRVATRVKGAGLGLFIVRSIVGKHGGKTFAESEGEGMGSVFTIELPRIENGARSVSGIPSHESAR